MISAQAQSGFDHIFKKAVLANISSSTDDNCEIEAIDNLEGINEDEFVVLTISSTFFSIFNSFSF